MSTLWLAAQHTRVGEGIFDPRTTLWTTERDESEADVTTAVAPSAAALNAGDRCDRCGAQAYLRVELDAGAELLFCAHHAREHGDKLRQVAIRVHDETHKLAGQPES
jgi:hypothetical protein